MSFTREQMLTSGAEGREGDAAHFEVAADYFIAQGDADTALIALDRAYGLAPDDPSIRARRAELLERFSIVAHGVVFRYVPAGSFLMGSTTGDPDERPVHAVELDAYWMAEVPVSWAVFADLAGRDVDSPPPGTLVGSYSGIGSELRDAFGDPEALAAVAEKYGLGKKRARPPAWDLKPMVVNDWREARDFAAKLCTDSVEYALPSEAQWEKAARGGLIGRRYPWGDAPPTPATCDCNNFEVFEIAASKSFAPNGYGLYAMSGGVWEWTASVYDALAYAKGEAATIDPALYELEWNDPDPPEDVPHQQVLRGGSWADAAAAATVSFRSARRSHAESECPNLGFRLLRRARS